MNFKYKVISHWYCQNFTWIHVPINFDVKHIKNYGWILRKTWIHDGLLKQWHCICHTYKIYMLSEKTWHIIVSKLKLKNMPTSNEVCKSKTHWNFPNIYFLLIIIYKKLPHFTHWKYISHSQFQAFAWTFWPITCLHIFIIILTINI